MGDEESDLEHVEYLSRIFKNGRITP